LIILGAIAEQVFKDFPKHLTSLSETVALLGRDLADRVWDIKSQLEQRISGATNKKEEKVKSK
jgi:predicted oxidoreductase (fatty acid repression mutant protein)